MLTAEQTAAIPALTPRDKWPQWVRDMHTEGPEVEVTPEGRVIWWGGTIHDGLVVGPIDFLGGSIRDGIVMQANFFRGIIDFVDWRDGYIGNICVWRDGVFRKGEFNGLWLSGLFLGGVFKGNWRDGKFQGGEFKGRGKGIEEKSDPLFLSRSEGFWECVFCGMRSFAQMEHYDIAKNQPCPGGWRLIPAR